MGLLTRIDLQSLAAARLEDAMVLLSSGRYSAAYYLVGYAVECALKACIAKETREFEFPDKQRVNQSWSHDLSQLAAVARIPVKGDTDADRLLESNWQLVVSKWSEGDRYRIVTQDEAHAMVTAVADTQTGVLQWLQKYW